MASAAPKRGTSTSAKAKARAKAAEAKAAATAETDGRKPIKWEGLELSLPDSLPLSFAFDMIEVEGASAAGSDLGSAMPLLRLLRSVFGPGQFARVRNALDQLDRDKQAEAFAELVNAVFSSYGVTPGES